MIDLGTLGGEESTAHAINDKGQVVGESSTRKTDPSGGQVEHAFIWQAGKMTDLGALRGNSVAEVITNSGQILGKSEAKKSWRHAVLWTLER